jgi:predicted Ser/Thr protein kinase
MSTDTARDGTKQTPTQDAHAGDTAPAEYQTVYNDKGDAATQVEQPRTFGDYELLDEIARGGMGVVYRARQRSLNRIVALKMILGGNLASSEAVKRFYKEAHAAAALDHPNIVPIYEIGEAEGNHFFSMAFVEGTSLKSLVAKKGKLAPAEAVKLMLPVVEAVEFAHRQNIVHRDLKPDNVLIDNDGRPRVTDFGLAKQMGEGDAGLTGTGQVLGTPAFMAPEQAMGKSEDVGKPADIYGLGGILYFLLTGKPPFTGKTLTEVLVKVAKEPVEAVSALEPNTPSILNEICTMCLAKDPKDRFKSAAELKEVLAAVQVSGDSAKTSTLTLMKQRPSRIPLLVAAAAVLVAVGAIGFATLWRPAPTAAEAALAAAFPPEVASRLLGNWKDEIDLKVQMVGGRPGRGGVANYVDGEDIRFRVETDKDAYIGIWTVERDGTTTQIFPNEIDKNNLIKAKMPRIVPDAKSQMVAGVTKGEEGVLVYASSQPWKESELKSDSPFVTFKAPKEKAELHRLSRAIFVREAGTATAAPIHEARKLLSYQVLPAAK